MDQIRYSEKSFPSVAPFNMKIKYVETTRDSLANENDSHVHPECEIYVNLSGDVSFMVEQRVYGISSGSIIITRPYEYHHCIYHSDLPHKHFWILFSPNGNEELFPRFFNRPLGEANLLVLSTSEQEELISLCFDAIKGNGSHAEELYRFFKLMNLIESVKTADPHKAIAYDDVHIALDYVDEHFTEQINLRHLAARCHVSLNTLERHFTESIGTSPTAYIKNKRMAHAAIMLSEGSSVTEACLSSGFSDYSGFIATFKQHYGVTPLKYKKRITKG